MLAAHQRPKLPAVQSVPVPQMKNRIEVVVGDDVPFARLDVKREHYKVDLVAEKAVLERSIDREQGSVIQFGNGGALLEVNWKERKAVHVCCALCLPA